MPDWLPGLEVHGIPVGGATLDVRLTRHGDSTSTEVSATRDLDVVLGEPPTPLWDRPMRAALAPEGGLPGERGKMPG